MLALDDILTESAQSLTVPVACPEGDSGGLSAPLSLAQSLALLYSVLINCNNNV